MARYPASLSLGFLACQTEIVTTPTPQDSWETYYVGAWHGAGTQNKNNCAIIHNMNSAYFLATCQKMNYPLKEIDVSLGQQLAYVT